MSAATIILQARITSKRLRNKVLKKIKGKTIIEIMIERLKFSKFYKGLIIAIPKNKKNKKLYDFLRSKGLNVQTGDENNVLRRYYSIAKKNKIKNIIRLTSDCPLIDYKIIDKVANKFFKEKLDHVCTDKSFAEGLDCEIFSFQTLKKIFKKAKFNSEKEHVTLFIKNNLKMFKTDKVKNTQDHSNYRFTLDEKKDFQVIKKIINRFPSIIKNEYISSEKIINFLRKNNQICKINSNITRNEGLLNSYKSEGLRILFLTQLNKKIGTGNTVRLINYSNLLNQKKYLKNIFIKTDKKSSLKFFNLDNFKDIKFYLKGNFKDFKLNVIKYIVRNNIKILFIDLFNKKNLYTNEIKNFCIEIKNKCNVKIILIGDFRSRNLSVDHLIIPQFIKDKSTKYFEDNVSAGLNCIPFSNKLKKIRYKNVNRNKLKNILVFISGSDPSNISYKIVKGLKHKNFENLKINVILNKTLNSQNYKNIENSIKENKNIKIYNFNKYNFYNLLKVSDLNILGEGLSMIESIFVKKPTLVIKSFNKKYSNLFFLKLLKSKNLINYLDFNKKFKDFSIELEKSIIFAFNNYSYNNHSFFKNLNKFDLNKIVERTLKNEIK